MGKICGDKFEKTLEVYVNVVVWDAHGKVQAQFTTQEHESLPVDDNLSLVGPVAESVENAKQLVPCLGRLDWSRLYF